MNKDIELMVQVAQEFVQPAFIEDGSTAVAFFIDNKNTWNLPTENEEQTVRIAKDFWLLLIAAMTRYENIKNMVNKNLQKVQEGTLPTTK